MWLNAVEAMEEPFFVVGDAMCGFINSGLSGDLSKWCAGRATREYDLQAMTPVARSPTESNANWKRRFIWEPNSVNTCPLWMLCRFWVWTLSNGVGWAFVRASVANSDPQCPKWGGKSKPKPSKRAGAQRPLASGPLCIVDEGRGGPGIDPKLQFNAGESPAPKASCNSMPGNPRHQWRVAI